MLHVVGIYWWFRNDDLLYPLAMIPPKTIPPFWHAIFLILVNGKNFFPPPSFSSIYFLLLFIYEYLFSLQLIYEHRFSLQLNGRCVALIQKDLTFKLEMGL